METFIRRLRQRVPVRYLEIPQLEDTELLLPYLKETAEQNPHYTLQVLKQLTQTHFEDSLFEFMSSLLGCEPLSPTDFEAITYTVRPGEGVAQDITVRIRESPRLISGGGTTGHRTWEAALYLSSYLLRHRHIVDGKKVLELGAGTGLVGLSVGMHTDAARVTLSDGSPNLIENLGPTLKLNSISKQDPKWLFQSLLWGETPVPREVDVLLGADVTYDASIIPALQSTIKTALSQNVSLVAYIAATIRNDETIAVWDKGLEALEGARWEIISRGPDTGAVWYSPTTPEIRVYKISML